MDPSKKHNRWALQDTLGQQGGFQQPAGEFSPAAYCIVIRRWILGVIMSNEKFTEKMGDAMLDPRHNRIWKGVLWLLGLWIHISRSPLRGHLQNAPSVLCEY